MPNTSPCLRCNAPNDVGARFCAGCGASLVPEVHCASCNALNPLGQRFCSQCGSTLAGSTWTGQGPGAGGVVNEGTWERGSDEFVRRVEPEDARAFLGNRVVRVPPGSVGVIVVAGAVDRVLPPGERTTLNLFERIGDFFLGRAGRSAFYLIDQRPIPIPFVIQARPAASGRSVRTQVLVSFTLPRGDKAALGTFLGNVLGDRPAFGANDLHALLRPEVVRVAQETLERMASERAEMPYGEAEAQIRQNLVAIIGPRFGLTLDVSLAPLTTLASLDFHLGRAPAARAQVPGLPARAAGVAHVLRCLRRETAGAGRAGVERGGAVGCDRAVHERRTAGRARPRRARARPARGLRADRVAPALVAAAASHLRRTSMARSPPRRGSARSRRRCGPLWRRRWRPTGCRWSG